MKLATIIACYIRGSTEEQQNTLGAQRTQLGHYCGSKLVPAEYFVDEGESATQTEFLARPKVIEMLAWMKLHGCTQIAVTKLDRAFRGGAVEALETVRILDEQGIGLHMLDLGVDPTTPVGKLVTSILSAVACFDCERKKEDQSKAFGRMRDTKQRTGAVPYGWDTVSALRTSKTGRAADDLIVNPKEMAVLKQILFWSKCGDSDSEIARNLNVAGIRTKNAGKPMSRKGKSWICDGKWSAAQVLSVRTHALLPDQVQTQAA